jgi:hypothetical protein
MLKEGGEKLETLCDVEEDESFSVTRTMIVTLRLIKLKHHQP